MNVNDAKRYSLIAVDVLLAAYFIVEILYGEYPPTVFLKGLPNVLAAGAALAAGAWITLAVVEKALKEDKKKTWEKVKERTYDEIIEYVGYIAISVQLAILQNGLTDEERKEVERINETIRNKTPNYNMKARQLQKQ